MTLPELFPFVSQYFFYGWAFLLGTIIGSFLNVYIYRFHTGKSLSGSSHCLSCGTKLNWYELFPLFSYLFLRGKCRTCRCRIPARYFLVELLTAIVFMIAVWYTNDVIELFLLWFILSVMVVVTVYDLYHFIIPDKLTIVLLILVSGWWGYLYYAKGFDLEMLMFDIVATLAGSGFFLFLWLVSRGRWLGFGDVKLAIPLGLLVGASSVFSFIVVSFWIGAGLSLLIIGFEKIRRGKAHLQIEGQALTMKSAVPFAPFLIAGCLVTFFTNFNVLQLFS